MLSDKIVFIGDLVIASYNYYEAKSNFIKSKHIHRYKYSYDVKIAKLQFTVTITSLLTISPFSTSDSESRSIQTYQSVLYNNAILL